jgi:hypothetical protein
LYFDGGYSTAQKKLATRGYTLGAQAGAMYCISGQKLFLVLGAGYRSYTGDLWAKKSFSVFTGLKYGLPSDPASLFVSYYFKEKQTNNQCEYLSTELTIRIWQLEKITIFTRWSADIAWFYQSSGGEIKRRAGVTKNIVLGILWRLNKKKKL